MARARLLKPGFFANEELCTLPPFGRLLFAGLWTIADREGRLVDSSRWVKAQVFPFDNPPVEKLLAQLAAAGFIERYEGTDGRRYIQVTNFGKHQHVHIKEGPSTIPAPDKHGASTVQSPVISSASPAEAEAEAVTEAKAETETEAPPPGFFLKEPDDIDQICKRFATFGLVNGGTVQAIEEAVEDYGVEWVKHAVRSAAGSSFTEKPPWSYVEQILIRYKKQGHIDEPRDSKRSTNGANAGQPRRAAGPDRERPSDAARRLGIGR